MEHAQLPPIDVTRYEWARSDKNTSLWQRQALAGESTWALKPRERRDLFLGGQLLLSTPSVFDHLGETAEAAWRQLRFEHPEIALSFKFDKDGKCLIEHYNPRGDSEVWAWVKRTLIVKASSQRLSFSNVRFMISQEKVKRDEAVFLYLYPQISSTNSRTTNITFMFHVDHLYSDGIGIRILAHCFFRLLSAELSAVGDESQARIDWQRNAEHLRPPWTGLMNGNQKTSGSAFDEAVRSKCALLLGASVCALLSTQTFSTFIVYFRRTTWASKSWQKIAQVLTCLCSVISPKKRATLS